MLSLRGVMGLSTLGGHSYKRGSAADGKIAHMVRNIEILTNYCLQFYYFLKSLDEYMTIFISVLVTFRI